MEKVLDIVYHGCFLAWGWLEEDILEQQKTHHLSERAKVMGFLGDV
jgi:hypothetical protein